MGRAEKIENQKLIPSIEFSRVVRDIYLGRFTHRKFWHIHNGRTKKKGGGCLQRNASRMSIRSLDCFLEIIFTLVQVGGLVGGQ